MKSPDKEGFFEGWRKHWVPRAAIMAIGIIAVGTDYICPNGETISEEVDRLRESERWGETTHAVLDALYHHFKRDIPPEEDKIHRFALLFEKDTL